MVSKSWERFEVGRSGCALKTNVVNAKGGPETNLQYETLSKTDCSCVPNLTGLEVKIKLENCNKGAREEVAVLVHTVCKVVKKFKAKWDDMVN